MRAGHDSASESLAEASGNVGSALPSAGMTSGQAAGRSGGVDPLSDVLETVRLRGALFFLWEVSWPYATCVPEAEAFGPLILPGAEQIVSYHIVIQGPCWAMVAGERPARLESGDILVVPHGDVYTMSSAPEVRAPGDRDAALAFFRAMAAGELPPVVVEGGGGPQGNRVICGFLGCDARPFNPVPSALPRMIHLRSPAPGAVDSLSYLVDLALLESREPRRGGRCVLLRLSELMFVEVIRRYLASAPVEQTGWLSGLRDPIVGRALGLLHERSGFPWTLERLAREVGASRSILAERFAHLVGQPPMQYLARWRMQLAARQLASGSAKIYAVAREVGYESEAAFSRAFKRIVGVTPLEWRERRS